MSTDLGFGRRRLINKIILQNWKIKEPTDKIFNFNELLFVVQELLTEEGKAYSERRTSQMGHTIFRAFVKHLLYRNLANYDSMVLLTSEKGCITGDALLEMGNGKKIKLVDAVGKNILFVKSMNIKTKQIEKKMFDDVVFVKTDDVWKIIVNTGESISGTSDHPFLLSDGTYKQLKELTNEDKIQMSDSKISFLEKKIFIGKQKVYDVVNVKDNHNFIVNGFVVSNTGKSSAAIMMGRYWCSLLGIRFNPARHIAYNNNDVLNKIQALNKFEPLICVPQNTYIRIRENNSEKKVKIKELVNNKNFEVLSYNNKKDKFEWEKPKEVKETGFLPVDTIELENGIKFQATSEHLVLTKNRGYIKVKNLCENDELILSTKICSNCKKEFYSCQSNQRYCTNECRPVISYYKKFTEKAKIYGRKRHKKKIKTDIYYRLRHNLLTRLMPYIQGDKNFQSKSNNNKNKVELVIGCSIYKLKTYIENKFKEGMSWNNYGNVWSLDHIIPLSTFNLTNVIEKKKCFHYTNMQPLWNNLNSAKGRWIR